MPQNKNVKYLHVKKYLTTFVSMVSVILLTQNLSYAEIFIEDTYGPEFIAPIITKDFRGAVSVERKYVPTKDIAPWHSVNAPEQNTTHAPHSQPHALKAVATATRPEATAMYAAVDTAQHSTEERGLSGGSSYSIEPRPRAVPLMPMYKDFLMYGITSNPIDSHYVSNLSGFSAVANIALDSMMRVGITFDVGIGHTSFLGDHYNTDNIYNFWGLSLFAGYNFDNIGLLFDVGYASEYSDVAQIKSANLLKGTTDSDFVNETLTAGMRTEYRLDTQLVTIAPHAGVRYTSTNFDAHTAHSEASTLAAWTLPVGVTLSKNFETYNGWALVPSVDLGFVATFGDLKATASMPSTANFSNFDMQAIDDFAFDGGLGLSLVRNGLSVDVNYNMQLSPKGAGHLVSGSLRLEF